MITFLDVWMALTSTFVHWNLKKIIFFTSIISTASLSLRKFILLHFFFFLNTWLSGVIQ